jgi:uncharacterized protein YqjF (DUF2071 family)
MKRFITAYWKDLIMANYEVDPTLLAARVPRGTELDLFEGRCFVSLVGFMFLDTRVFGIPVPFHVNFEEVNLRYYVKRIVGGETRRGVCFIKEIVPRTAIAAIARLVYGEPYERWSMSNMRDKSSVAYSWSKGPCRNRLELDVDESVGVPPVGSHGEFIIEHYWGYTRRGGGRVDEYKVEHPKWELYSVRNERIDVDFGATYGSEFDLLTGEKPFSVLLAKGSEVTVYKGEQIL